MAGMEELNFAEEIAFLVSMFEGTVSPQVIASVIESYSGDVHLAADAIMNFTDETPAAPPDENNESNVKKSAPNTTAEPTAVQQPSSPSSQEVEVSPVSEAFRSTGAVPKRPLNSLKPKPNYRIPVWPDQIGQILHHHNQGSRILILMRGAAGSGKTYLARHIIDYTVGAPSQNYARHIFSTDSYFMRGGMYQFNRNNLDEAHSINQRKVCDATNKGISPIIVDNTNMEMWEMEPYVRDGVRNGYIIEIVEPRTPWARDAVQLSKKNTHAVPRETIRRSLDRYENVTPESMQKRLKLVYPANKKPPVKRNIPPVVPMENFLNTAEKTTLNKIEYDKDDSHSTASTSNGQFFHFDSRKSPDKLQNVAINHSGKLENMPSSDDGCQNMEQDYKLQKIIEAQQKLEQFEKVEKEWENGESWQNAAVENMTTASQNLAMALEPRPSRRAEKNDTDKFIEPANICDDWTKISMFMPPWQDTFSSLTGTVEAPIQVETESVGTGFEEGDREENKHKVLNGIPRNINENTPETKRSKIPQVVMLDKSTSTHDTFLVTDKKLCKNKEYHFKQLCRMFKSLPNDMLRCIFESCNCDISWAVDLVLDDYPGTLENLDNNEDKSDSEDEPIEDCDCLAAYNITPAVVLPAAVSPDPEKIPQSSTSTPLSQKKTKKENKVPSESSLQLKRHIENNVIISENHYSQNYLNLRRRREVHIDGPERASESISYANIENVTEPNASGLDMDNAVALPESYTENSVSRSNDVVDNERPSTSHYNFEFMDPMDSDTESDSNKSDNLEKTVSINMGPEFLAKLDELFGREGFQYPEYIQPVVNLPMSLLQQINAHWAVSVAFQMDDGSQQSEAMIKQDEDFARQIAAKEQELTQEGKKPDVPTLKEIMDMELAYSIYERSVAEWRNNEPQDLAAKLSREKLYNLFPDISRDVLAEMLMAHDYSFKDTIESLIISTGQSNWLEDEKGVERFVMHKEMERKEKFVEEQTKNLNDAEWPYLGNPEKPVTLETVNYYRDEAQKSLVFRNANFEKARQYFVRNSPYAASFYSEIAALHTKKYEQSSCLAAAYLMNYHLMNNPGEDVLDLHYLRVPEAMVNLDIFLDQIIFKLRSKNTRSKEVWVITGKGTHSKGGPRIKPATKRRFKTRAIMYKEANGGLLVAQLHPGDKMTNELPPSDNS